MKEFVYVEFLIEPSRREEVEKILLQFGDDFIRTKHELEYDIDNMGYAMDVFYRIGGSINSSIASILKLQNAYLADRMVISYISDELKNKYRK